MEKILTYVLPIINDNNFKISSYRYTIDILSKINDKIKIIIYTESTANNITNYINKKLSDFELLTDNYKNNNLAYIYNKAIENCKTKYIYFGLVSNILNLNHINSIEKNSKNNNIYYLYKYNEKYPSSSLLYGYLLTKKMFNISEMFFNIDIFSKYGVFNENVLLKYDFDWEFCLRVCNECNFIKLKYSNTSIKNTLYSIYHKDIKNLNLDIRHRLITIINSYKDNLNIKNILKNFNIDDQLTIIKHFNLDLEIDKTTNPLKFTIIMENWGYIHTQLCLLNYIENLYDIGYGTYKIILSYKIKEEDVITSDIVFFVRCKHLNTLKILNYCNNNLIKTIYILDDNWFSVSSDWKTLYKNFTYENDDEYKIFIKLLSNSNYVITYSEILKEDIKNYNKNVFIMPININLDNFINYKKTSNNKKLIVGYAGTLRFTNNAFLALYKISKEIKNINILLFGVINKKISNLFDNNLILLDYMSYKKYCNTISKLNPDILIAPLDNSKTSKSKCANKYLEITAANAVGIYSNITPYKDVITNNYNGILVNNDTINEWKNKIYLAINNYKLRNEIIKNSKLDIEKNYQTKIVQNSFIKLINKFLSRSKK